MKILMAFFLCVIPILTRAQVVMSGTILDVETNHPLEGAIIKVLDTDNRLIAYTTSSEQGKYSLKFTSQQKSIFLSISFLGYKTVSVKVANQNIERDFTLQTDAIMLNEVYVKPPAITKIGDTLTYNVNQFKLEQDRSISDVLKKMPGIEINELGTISYQGKPISKFYIEGMDLLGKKYALANNSIPSDAIGSVQILENHQPVKALKGLAYSDRAALNLVLKDKHRIKPVGYIEGGIGGMKDEALWSADLFSLFITARKQSLFSYKSNNTGPPLSSMMTEQIINTEDLLKEIPTTPENLFAKTTLAELPIKPERYQFNRSHLATYNQLWKTNKMQYRLTAAYLNEQNKQRIYTNKEYFLPDNEQYLTIENTSATIRDNKATLTLSLESNESQFYINNSTDAYADWQNVSSQISGNRAANSHLFKMPTFGIQNNLNATRRVKDNALSFYSYIRYINQPQNLAVHTETEDLGLINQSAKRTLLYTINGADFSYSYLKSVFNLGARFLASANSYKTSNNHPAIVAMNNRGANYLKDSEYSIQALPQYNYNPKKIKFKISVPISYTYYYCKEKDKVHTWGFEPTLFLRFDLTNYWNASINYSHKKQLGDLLDFVDSPVMQDYQTSFMGSGILEERKSDTYSCQLAYRNQIDALFFYLSAIYRPITANTIRGNLFKNNQIISYKLPQSNDRDMTIVTSSLAKFIDCIQTNVSITMGYTQTLSSLYQQQQLYPLDVETYRIETKIESKISAWLNIEANIQWYKSLLTDKENPTRKTQYIRPNVTGYIIPAKHTYLSLSAEYSYKKNNTDNSTHYLFTDMKANYQKDNWEITLAWQNIFNNRLYENISYSELNSSYLSPFTPRQYFSLYSL